MALTARLLIFGPNTDWGFGWKPGSGLKNLERGEKPDLDALAAMYSFLAWCDLRLALLLGGH